VHGVGVLRRRLIHLDQSIEFAHYRGQPNDSPLMNVIALLSAGLATAMLMLAWVSVGSAVLRPVRSILLPSERLSLAILAGAGLTGVGLFVVGQLQFSSAVVATFIAVACLPLWSPRARADLLGTWRELELPARSVALPLACLVVVLVLAGLSVPVGDNGSDGISYHLLGPLVWLREHRIVPVLDMSHTAFPAAIETLFAAGMALSNERAPGLLGAALCLAVVVQVFGFARWLGSSVRWAQGASLLVACIPVVTVLGPSPFVDVEYAGFALAAVRLLLGASPAHSYAGALFLGLAMATKYNGLTLCVSTLAIFGAHRRFSRGSETASTLKEIAVCALCAFILAAPFYLRNWIFLGNPIYPPPPLLARLMPPKAFPMAASIDFQNYIRERGKGLGRGVFDLLALPWRFTFHTASFHGAGGVGVAPLAFIPAAMVAKWNRTLGYVLAWGALNTLVWFAVQQEARFLLPVILAGVAAAVLGAEALVETFPRLGRLGVGAVMVLSVVYGGSVEAKALTPVILSTVSTAREAVRLRDNVPYLRAFAFLNALPEPCRVLLLGPSVPPYYLKKDYVKIRGGYGEVPIEGVVDSASALASLHQLRITHVMDVRASEQSTASAAERFLIPLPPPPNLELLTEIDSARVFRVVTEATAKAASSESVCCAVARASERPQSL